MIRHLRHVVETANSITTNWFVTLTYYELTLGDNDDGDDDDDDGDDDDDDDDDDEIT